MDTKSASIVGVIILGVISLGLVLWYMSEHPAPVTMHPVSTTPGGNSQNTGPNKIVESTKYYDISTTYPDSTSLKQSAGATADAKAIEVMKQFELNSIAAFKEQGNFDHLSPADIAALGFDRGQKESLEITYETKTGPKTISYIYTLIQDTLGAHPNSYIRTFVFDSRTGAGIQLSDVFASGTDYLQLLSTVARKKLPALIAKNEGIKSNGVDIKYMDQGTTPDSDNFQNWYIEDSSLVLIFPAYQVAPYSAGEQILSIPFSELGSSVNTKFR